MKHFLLVPVAALAFLAVATPAAAQSVDLDLRAQANSLRRESDQNARAADRIQRTLDTCGVPDPDVVLQLQDEANDISRRAAGVAWQMSGRDHAVALDAQRKAETTYWSLAVPHAPDKCYVAPAE